MRSRPLVSAIMPTRGREGWARDAERMFQEQTYPEKQLVIVDDLMERSFVTGIQGPGIVYLTAPRLTIGEKRNLAVSNSAGDIIMHWDSDDKYRADRMEHQVELLLEKGVDLVGYNTMEFEDADLGTRYLYRASPGYAIGVSQTYWRDSWEAHPFERVDVGEDDAFLNGKRVYSCDSDGRIVARIHHGNTSNKRMEIPKNASQWQAIA